MGEGLKMYDEIPPNESLGVQVSRRGERVPESYLSDQFHPRGRFNLEIHRKNGEIETYDISNLVTTQGKNAILDIMFGAATQITAWYMGLVTTTSFTAFAATDTAAQIGGTNGWTESTVYSGGPTRKSWSPAAASAGSISNTTVVTFSITSSDTLKGAFIISSNSGTGGKLWAEVAFPSAIAVSNGDDVKVTYTLSS